jgi:hypothetical protein
LVRNEKVGARVRTAEIDRYRLAAEEALEQLDWCVSYLQRIRKYRIAKVIEQNRSQIRREMNRSGD